MPSAAVLAVSPSRVGAVPLVLLVVARLLLFVVITLTAAAVLLVPLAVFLLLALRRRRAGKAHVLGLLGDELHGRLFTPLWCLVSVDGFAGHVGGARFIRCGVVSVKPFRATRGASRRDSCAPAGVCRSKGTAVSRKRACGA